ncbi:MAG: WYL domain-containing protein [Gammaproteobacteria bacterium]|nr:WYL domain-containing protein [Gammaproteobacteria bacterium]
MDRLSETSQKQRERLSHIDFRAQFLGEIGRNDICARFGIGGAAATRDITLYRKLAPNNLEYNPEVRSYVKSDAFEPLFDCSPTQALAALSQGFGSGSIGSHKAMIRCETPELLNTPSLSVLAALTRAIHQGRVVRIQYRSIQSGLSSRKIVPFALVDNGLRWHVRAYDRKRHRFADFVITRITSPKVVEGEPKEQETREADIQWNRVVEMELVAHPKLLHPETIERDYAMRDGLLRVNVRAAVAGYVLRLWNVDCTEDHSLEGAEHHLWLRNSQALYGVQNLVLAPGYSG